MSFDESNMQGSGEFVIPIEDSAPVTETEIHVEEAAPSEQPIAVQPAPAETPQQSESQPTQETAITTEPTPTETLLADIQKVNGAKTASLNGVVLTVTYTPNTNHDEITRMQTEIAILLSKAGLPINYIDYQKAP
jgi:hypothetical protein